MHLKDNDEEKYAVKIYSKQASRDADVRHFCQEMRLLHLDHPNIIKLIDVNECGKLYRGKEAVSEVRYSVLELASNGNFLDYIANNAMDEGIVRYYFKQLCMAVDYMHRQGICHRDLKLENLLLDVNFNLKVSDFGFCTELANKYGDNIHMTCKGTPGYMAPEMMNINGYNYVKNQKCHKLFSSNGYNGKQTDIFALGVILFGMIMGRPPFKIADIDDPFYRMIFCHQIEEFWNPWDVFANQCGSEIPDDFKDLFISMVTFNPLMRLTINEILGSKWMNRNTPSETQVFKYMSLIKEKIEEFEEEQRIFLQNIAQNKKDQHKIKNEEECCSEDQLNYSSLSVSSQMKDDEDLIMKDLEEIEKEFGDINADLNFRSDFNLGENEFDLGNDQFSNKELGIDNSSIVMEMEISLM